MKTILQALAPQLLVLHTEGGLPHRGHHLYEIFEKKSLRLTYWQYFVAFFAFAIAVIAFIAGTKIANINLMASLSICLLSVLLFAATTIGASRMKKDGAEDLHRLAHMLLLKPRELCALSEPDLKRRASKTLRILAKHHEEWEQQYPADSPKLKISKEAFENSFDTFKEFELIPAEAEYGLYFHRTTALITNW